MIAARNLTRRFGRSTAVDDVSFALEPGEVVGFLGPNGAGKTTTLRMITGFLPPTAGSVEVDGHDTLRDSLEVRRRLGYLPESVPLYREHRVSELFRFHSRLFGMAPEVARRRSDELLERVGLTERRRALVGTLSKGQRQRVGLALALLPDPPALVLDEPTSGLDPLQRLEVRRLVAELAVERTVLFSSHVLAEVEAACPRVIILVRGRLVADGTPADLVDSLGGAATLRVEVDHDAAAELAALAGVEALVDAGGSDGFRCFELTTSADVRARVGALARERGWTLRALALARPSLETLFARVALAPELDGAGEREDEGDAA